VCQAGHSFETQKYLCFECTEQHAQLPAFLRDALRLKITFNLVRS
jgi:hypothetical protein